MEQNNSVTEQNVSVLPRLNRELSENKPFALLNFSNAENSLKDMIPIAKIEYLANKNNPAEFKKGAFSFNLGYQKEEVRIVLLAMKYGRQLWEKYNPNKENVVPLCSSSNGEHSTNGIHHNNESPQVCSSCKHAQWDDDQPPACSDTYSLLCYDVDDSLPFIIQVKKTGIMALRKLKTALKVTAPKWAYPQCAPNACVSIMMRSKPVDNYYVLDFPQKDLKGNPLWQRLTECQSHELTKLALDLSKTFTQMDLQEEALVSNSESSSVPF